MEKNTLRANSRLSLFLLVCAAFQSSVLLFDSLGMLEIVPICRRHILVQILLPAAGGTAGLLFRGRKKWLREFLIAVMLVYASLSCLLYPAYLFLFPAFAVLFAESYYDTAFTARVIVESILLYAATVLLGLYLQNIDPDIRELHEVNHFLDWDDPAEIVRYEIFTKLLLMLLISAAGALIARNGRRLLSEQAEVSGRNAALEADLSTAATIQSYALPTEFDFVPDGLLRVFARMRPAKEVAGDFYDCFMFRGQLYFLVADVSDKGLAAAMFMMTAKNTLHILLQNDIPMAEAVATANRRLCENNKSNMFVSLLLCRLNPETGEGTFVCAGHNPPVFRHKDGNAEITSFEPDTILGVFEDAEYHEMKLRLDRGDSVLLYTDGTTDATNGAGEMFGTERLMNIVSQSSGLPEPLLGAVFDALARFEDGSTHFDDVTLLAVHRPEDVRMSRSITLPAEQENTQTVIDTVNGLLNRFGCTEHDRRQTDVILDEVLANICDYAYPDGEGNMTVEYTVDSGGIRLVFTDNGIPFNPVEADAPSFDGEPQVGGLGIYLTKQLSDEISYERRGGSNVLSVFRSFQSASSDESCAETDAP